MNQRKCLLIVESDPDLRELLGQLCAEVTQDIKTAANGIEALNMISEGNVDVVLSEITLPKMSGLALLARLRDDGNEIPFIILSGYGNKDNATEALRLGATDFIDKPFHNEGLLSSIHTAMEYGVALREAEEELELAYKNAKQSPHRLLRLKRARKTLWAQKDSSLLKKKANSA